MQKIICMICMLIAIQTIAQTNNRHLLGKITKDSLLQKPYAEWYNANYSSYHPLPNYITSLKTQKWKDVSAQVFFGSWCGDSKREVPRFLKIMDSIGVPAGMIELIGTDNKDSATKKSPTGEEKDKGIFRVPTFIFYKNGIEVNRIIETPALSLEADILQIVSNQTYGPNYSSFSLINKWLLDGSLLTDNTSTVGMANQLKPLVTNEYTINSLANLLIAHKKDKEALKLLRINYNMFNDKLVTQRALAEQFIKLDDKEKAVPFLELALKQSKDKEFDEILQLLYKAKGVK